MAERLADLDFLLGEGPAADVVGSGNPVVQSDLGGADRWPAYTRAAIDQGVRAVFAFPLCIGAINFGALILHRREPRTLDDGEFADARLVATLATLVVLDLQAQVPPGSLHGLLGDLGHTAVHQATGMVSAQLELSLANALAVLRARAYSDGRSVYDVAKDVVARTLRFA